MGGGGRGGRNLPFCKLGEWGWAWGRDRRRSFRTEEKGGFSAWPVGSLHQTPPGVWQAEGLDLVEEGVRVHRDGLGGPLVLEPTDDRRRPGAGGAEARVELLPGEAGGLPRFELAVEEVLDLGGGLGQAPLLGVLDDGLNHDG